MFKTRLKELREAAGLSQPALASMICVSQQLISAYEIGVREPSNAVLSVLADVFSCSTDYLLGRTDEK